MSARSIVVLALLSLVPRAAEATCSGVECQQVEVVSADCKPVDALSDRPLHVAISGCEECCSVPCEYVPWECEEGEFSKSSCGPAQPYPGNVHLVDDQHERVEGSFVAAGECGGRQLFRFDGELEVGETYDVVVGFNASATVTVGPGGVLVVDRDGPLGGCRVAPQAGPSPLLLLLCLLALARRSS